MEGRTEIMCPNCEELLAYTTNVAEGRMLHVESEGVRLVHPKPDEEGNVDVRCPNCGNAFPVDASLFGLARM